MNSFRQILRKRGVHGISCALLFAFLLQPGCHSGGGRSRKVEVDFSQIEGTGSPYVFGATQPRGLSLAQWDTLKAQGFRFARSQADMTRLVPCSSPGAYRENRDGCAEPENWDWERGIYGNDFVRKAAERGMRVCLVVKNATWNRYSGAPDDEETIPLDLEVWGEILTGIINHYRGAIHYIEFYNEVDREPQFITTGSPWSRKEGYRAVVRRGLRAIEDSDYPSTVGCIPAAAGTGEEPIRWILEEEDLRSNLGAISFHSFDSPSFPVAALRVYRDLKQEFGVDIPVIRSSYVPEFNRSGGLPGTLKSAYIAPHLIGALKTGLEAAGLWEIQNRESEQDPRYWFDGTQTVQTAHLYRMMSLQLGLGGGPSQIVTDSDSLLHHVLGAVNYKGEKVLVAVNPSRETRKFNWHVSGLETNEVELVHYSGTEGVLPVRENRLTKQGTLEFSITLDAEEVTGIRIVEQKTPFSILFIAVDDLRPELGCYGAGYIHSPNIDRIASQGFLFERAYCSMSWCAPSRTSLMTGLRPGHTGVWDLQTHFRECVPSAVTMPQFFKQMGYTSLGFGKLYHNDSAMQDPLSWSEPCWIPEGEKPILAYATEANRSLAEQSPARKAAATEAASVPDNAYPDGRITEEAVRALREISKKEKPFFLGVGFYKPHLPFTAPARYWELYDPSEIPLAEQVTSVKGGSPHMFREWSEPGSYSDIGIPEPYPDSLSRRLKHGYAACVSYIDAQVGVLMDELERLDLDRRTIVVLWGDHGWKLGEYGRWSKHSNMEVDTRVPLLIRLPARQPVIISDVVESIDLYPTLVRMAGFTPPEGLDGEYLLTKRKNHAISQIPRDTVVGTSIRTPRYRYTEWYDRDHPGRIRFRELYDHRQGDGELVNVLAEPGMGAMADSLRHLLENTYSSSR